MNDKVKLALIAAIATVGVAWIVMHYSPYQTCVRAKAARIEADVAEVRERYKAAEPVSNQVVPGFEAVPSVPPSAHATTVEDTRTAELKIGSGWCRERVCQDD